LIELYQEKSDEKYRCVRPHIQNVCLTTKPNHFAAGVVCTSICYRKR